MLAKTPSTVGGASDNEYFFLNQTDSKPNYKAVTKASMLRPALVDFLFVRRTDGRGGGSCSSGGVGI